MFIIFRNNSYEYVIIRYRTIRCCYFINHLEYSCFNYAVYLNDCKCYINYEDYKKNNIMLHYSRASFEYYDIQSSQLRDYNQLFIKQINGWDYICL